MRIKAWFIFLVLISVCFPLAVRAQLTVTPDPLDFGDVILTEILDDQLTLENSGTSDILITNFSLTTPGNGRPSEFEILSPSTRTFLLTPGGKRTITFRFAPDFEGLRTITLLVETDQGDFSFGLKGTGVLTHPELALSTTSINFGKVSISGKKEVIVTITNVGEDDAKVSDVNVANFSGIEHFIAEPEDPTIPFPVILAQGESMKLKVTFQGAAPLGFKAGSITLVGSVGGQILIDVSGEVVGADLLINPDPIDFGDVDLGVPVSKVVTITALSEEPIEIDYINELFTPFAYATPPPVPLTLQPGVPYQLEIRLVANAPGPITSQIQFVSEDFSGSNFKGVTITANGRTPVRVANSDDFDFYCGARKSLTRTATIENRGASSITIQGFIAPPGVVVQTGTPLSIGPASTSVITYEFDPQVSGIERDLVIEYLDASSVLVRDTIHVKPITPSIALRQTVSSNGLDLAEVKVSSSFDLTDLGLTGLKVRINFDDPDMFALVRDSVRLNAQLLPDATFDFVDNGDGSYDLEIHSSTSIAFDPALSLNEQSLFSYTPISFTTRESTSLAMVELIRADLCAELSIDSVRLFTTEFCGADLIRGNLSGLPIRDLFISPNPVTISEPVLDLVTDSAQPVEITIVDLNGSVVERLDLSTIPGRNRLVIPTNDLSDGAYVIVLNLRSISFRRELKFVVTR